MITIFEIERDIKCVLVLAINKPLIRSGYDYLVFMENGKKAKWR